MSDLSGCYAKLERASEHLDLLQEEIRDRGYTVELVQGFDLVGNIVFVAQSVPEPPMRWATIIGDVVHNLRSALDHSICAIAIQRGQDCQRPRTQFVVVGLPETWARLEVEELQTEFDRRASRSMAHLSTTELAFLESLQPYRALDLPQRDIEMVRHHPLYVLEELWNRDKHRLPTLGFFAMEKWVTSRITATDADVLGFSYPRRPYVHGEAALTIHWRATGPAPLIELAGAVHPSVVFEDGEPVVATLQQAAIFVAGIVTELEGWIDG